MKKLLNSFLCIAGLGLGLVAGAVSCETVDDAFDCQSVCSKYQSCVDKDYDVGACRSKCRSNADKDSDFRRKADACEVCISDRACAEATTRCATSCLSIVP